MSTAPVPRVAWLQLAANIVLFGLSWPIIKIGLEASTPLWFAAARAEFDKQTSEMKYFAVLPADAKPPLDLNKETMDRYRPAMRQFYLDKPVRFE